MVQSRLKGNTIPVFSLSNLGSSPSAIEPGEDLLSINLVDGEGDQVTFGDYANGLVPSAFEIEGVYSGDAGSFYSVLWDKAGQDGVEFVWGPHGNSTAAAGKPIFTGVLTLGPRPRLETEANDGEAVNFSTTMQIDSIERETA